MFENNDDLEETRLDPSKYVFVANLGVGGCGIVNLYFCKETETFRAIKLVKSDMPNESALSDQALFYFVREVKTLHMSRHPTIMQLFSYGTPDVDMFPWMELEFIPGGSVFDLIARTRRIEGTIDPTCQLKILYGTAYALAFLHDKGVAHRDVKSTNIILDHNLEPHLADFGFARELVPGQSRLSKPNTPNYSPPELLQGQGSYDFRVDVYSFGMMMYELIEMEIPYNELDQYSIYRAISERNIPMINETSPYYNIYTRCIQYELSNRPRMIEVENMLNELAREIPGIDMESFDEYQRRITSFSQNPYQFNECGTIENLEKAAKVVPNAMVQLAKLYLEGIVVEKNINKASELYSRACELGDMNALETFISLIDDNKIPMIDEDKYEEYLTMYDELLGDDEY